MRGNRLEVLSSLLVILLVGCSSDPTPTTDATTDSAIVDSVADIVVADSALIDTASPPPVDTGIVATDAATIDTRSPSSDGGSCFGSGGCDGCVASKCCPESSACADETACQEATVCLFFICKDSYASCMTSCNTKGSATFTAYATCIQDKGCATACRM